jgi:hypothetical protein
MKIATPLISTGNPGQPRGLEFFNRHSIQMKAPLFQGPEGRPPNVIPARKGWETNPNQPSAVGAALNLFRTYLQFPVI